MRKRIVNKKFLTKNGHAKFDMKDTVLFDDDVELPIHRSDSESDKSFNKLGIVCIDDTCDSPNQEGSSQMDKHSVCKIDQIPYPSFTPNTWQGDNCVSFTIDSDKSGLFDTKEFGETITGIRGQSITANKDKKKENAVSAELWKNN